MKKLESKTAIVTGGSRGIGLAIVKEFAKEGANVIVCCSKRTDERDKMFQEIAICNNVNIYPIYFDMGNEDSIKSGLDEIKSLKLPIDILVNNAGVSHMAILPFTKMNDVRNVFQINFFAHLQMIQGLIGFLKKSSHPSIINMASVAGIDGGIGVSVYGATKASLILLTKVLSKELAHMKIRVNAVAPGMIDTELASEMGEKAINDMVESTAVGRIGKTEEVAKTVAFLSSEESSYINGQVIRIDGGI